MKLLLDVHHSRLAALRLTAAGYDVVAVAGPHDALAALRRRPDIKLLLIDVVMQPR